MNNTFEFINLPPEDYKKKAKVRMGWRILTFLGSVFLILLITVRNELGSIYGYTGTLVFAAAGMLYLHYKKNPEPLFVTGAIAGSVISQTSLWFVMETSHFVDFAWIATCSVLAFLGTRRQTAALILLINILGIGYFTFFSHNAHLLQMPQLNGFKLTAAYLEIVLSFFTLGYLLYQFIGFQEIWEKAYQETNRILQKQNQTVKKQNLENVILLKEIHHRVKNNLQIIISLLRLQKNELKSDESRSQFQEAINRIMIMSSIHQKLYQQEKLDQLNFEQYIEDLIAELVSLFKKEKMIRIDLSCTLTYIDLKTTVPVGLLLNELISNSLKYAFTEKEEGTIKVAITETSEGFTILYKDSGKWKKDEKSSGFGLELIDMFTEQLNGTKSFQTDQTGTQYIFDMKLGQ